MEIQELIAMAADSVIEERHIEELKSRLIAAEKEFETQARSKTVDRELLARAYSL